MLNPNHLNFSSVRSKLTMNEFVTLKSSKTTGISRTVKFSELSRPSARQPSQNDEQLKVVKLIGDQQKNIEEILEGLNCQCGCRAEFKKILDLLMGKIYRLREERNQLKRELEGHKANTVEKINIGVGINFEEEMQEKMREELLKLIQDSKIKMKSKEAESIPEIEVTPIDTEEIRNLMGLGQVSITFQNEANQTNLLEESPMRVKGEQTSNLSYESECFQQNVLRQSNNNTRNTKTDTKLGNLKTYCHQRSLDLDTLENYIQKLNCAKVLSKYETQRRKNAIF